MIHSVLRPGKEMSRRRNLQPPSQETYPRENGTAFCGERKECELLSFPTRSFR